MWTTNYSTDSCPEWVTDNTAGAEVEYRYNESKK